MLFDITDKIGSFVGKVTELRPATGDVPDVTVEKVAVSARHRSVFLVLLVREGISGLADLLGISFVPIGRQHCRNLVVLIN